MIRINDSKLMNRYLMQHNILEIFSENHSIPMELLLYKKNEFICRDGEALEYLLFFVQGKAKVYTALSNGKSLLLSFYEDFEVLGDLEVVNLQAASTNVQAIEDTYCIGISFEYVRGKLISDNSFLKFICGSLGQKLNRLSKNSSINLLYPLENRLASYILAAGERIDQSGKKLIVMNESLTEISELLGASYRHLLRNLNNLQEKGIIKKNKSSYEVVDEERLVELAADLYH